MSTLADTLHSLERQSIKPAEVIVIDDSSDDGSAYAAESHPLRPRVIRLDRNRGVAFARNTGLVEAKSDFVAFLDQDDLWLPQRTARLEELLRRNSSWGAIVTSERVFGVEEDRVVLNQMAHAFLPWIEYWRPGNAVLSLLDDVPIPSELGPCEEITSRRLLAGSVTVT